MTGLSLSRWAVDRSSWHRPDTALMDQVAGDPDTRVVDVVGDKVAVTPGPRLRLRAPHPGDVDLLGIYLGQDGAGHHYRAVVRPAVPVADGAEPAGDLLGLRELGLVLDDAQVGLATTAVALANWHALHTHCARCGATTGIEQAGWLRRCPQDGSETYPVTHPAVIMSVIDDRDRLLLARNANWPPGRMSVLAGFVEPGEPLEAAVAREVREEVGVIVDQVRYLGNQPWPFPASLMIAFTAHTSDPTLRVDAHEIASARWFTRAEFAAEVGAGTVMSGGSELSIAYHLIERWYGAPIRNIPRHTG